MYHWIRSLANEPVSIYTFSPHGSKNITDLQLLSKEDSCAIAPEIVCHDQEPLCYNDHQDTNIVDLWMHRRQHNPEWAIYDATMIAIKPKYQNLNFYTMLRALKFRSIFDRYILLHSEKNSKDVDKFAEVAEPVYYWCHGLIARDWYRFAKHDSRLKKKSAKKQTFLVYCRSWSGTREYRLKFLDLLAEKNLISDCKISILHQDQNYQLENYQCNQSEFQPVHMDQLIRIPNNNYSAGSSADYCADDMVDTNISVVLETVAADTKIHLTEKILRPIACAHPFMIVAGPGALEYLKSYGFKTFSDCIDESYDLESDVVKRMEMVTVEMLRIQNLPQDQKNLMFSQMQQIADYNQKHFFSETFTDMICKELSENLNQAINTVKATRGQRYLELRKTSKLHAGNTDTSPGDRNVKRETFNVLRKLRKDPTTSIKHIVDQFPVGFFNS